MGLDLSDIFGGAQASQDAGAQDALTATGASALGFLEGKAISALQASQGSLNATAQASASKILASPNDPNGFGAYFSGLMTNPALSQYGPYLLAGAVGVFILAYVVARG